MPKIDPGQLLRVYVEFLKIPADRCPPDYYSLLAVPASVHGAAAIDEAAKLRSQQIRRGLPADLNSAGRTILRRIARARICLLDVAARAAYDTSITVRTRVDGASKPVAQAASSKMPATGAHRQPTIKRNPSKAGTGRGLEGPTFSSRGSQPPAQRPTPPALQSHSQNALPELDEFDDLLAELPDVCSSSEVLPPVRSIGTKTATPQKNKSTKSPLMVYATVGSILILCVVAAGILLLSSGDADKSLSAEGVAANVGDSDDVGLGGEIEPDITTDLPRSNRPARDAEITTRDNPTPELPIEIVPDASYIPDLPLAKRINEDTTKAEYKISGGVFSVSIGMPIPVDEAIQAFVVPDAYEAPDFSVLLEFNGAEQEGGYFNVSGRAVQPKLFVDDAEVLEIESTGDVVGKLLSPGKANLAIHFDGLAVRLSFLVTELNLVKGFGKKEVIDVLGFPDDTETGHVSWPSSKIVDGELYEAKAGGGGGSWDHWYYKEYPVLAFVPNRGKIRHVFPKEALTLVQPPPKASDAPAAVVALEPLPAEIALPERQARRVQLGEAVETPVDIGAAGNLELETLDLSVVHPVAEKPGQDLRFEISRSNASEDNPVWHVRLRTTPKGEGEEQSVLDEVSAGLDEMIGKIFVEDSRFKFSWTATKYTTLAEQLRNCVLILKSAGKSHSIALRTCSLVEPLVVDFSKSNFVIKLEEKSLPPIDSLFLEVTALDYFDIPFEQQPPDGIIGFGDTVKLKLTTWDKPAEFRIKFGGSRSKPAVVISAHYQLDRKWQQMTLEEVHGGISDMQDALNRAQSDLSWARSALGSLPSQIDNLLRQLDNASGSEWIGLQSQLRNVKGQLRKASGMARRSSNLIPEVQAKIPQLQALGRLGNQLHQKARIQFRVAVRNEHGALDLLRTSEDANRDDAEASTEKTSG